MEKTDIDEKALKIQEYIESGESREEIAGKFGYKNWKCLDIYMRRQGMKWDSKRNIYYNPLDPEYNRAYETTFAQPKISMIINMFDNNDSDPMKVAKRAGFKDHREMASYMSARGYKWSYEQNNYVKLSVETASNINSTIDEISSCAENTASEDNDFSKYIPLLEFAMNNKDKIYEFLQSSFETIPRYVVPGINRTKSFYMSDKLSNLVGEFSEKYNISQKEIIEAALIEFLKTHSFKDEVEHLLRSP